MRRFATTKEHKDILLFLLKETLSDPFADGETEALNWALGQIERLDRVELTWTRERPTKAGNYWVRNQTRCAIVMKVSQTQDKILFSADPPIGEWNKLEWAGPIPEPREPKT